ncbi:GMC family oxidoreductase [Bradyrhizobium macuxiense]|uniref:GMC family oxidoreductase n=1 Tax=Bradyrhizobium macuxiense TaxID=1755647 RepID=A0A109JWC4_9BRAD|nr:GMC family oxidoreductase [Bradyrhizobium macuxiense]KWV56322.1 GMC family oxidoreductase [Bradyrhizobium macuxiense]
MARRLPRTDVAIVGLGWTGSILAYELSHTGHDVVAIERGPWRDTATDFNIGTAPDELRYAVRHEFFLRPRQETLTARNCATQEALPIRKWGSFLPGNGVGGAGAHWNGQTWRFLPDDFRIRSHMIERYGEKILPEDNHIQDWPVSYDELAPYYEKFELVLGVSGKAGNLKGKIQTGGNPFEGVRKNEYPTPPMKQGYAQELFTKAATSLGLHPFPLPSANVSVAYTNQYGCTMAPCTYCGFCERFGCANYSKSSPQTCVLPALVREPTFEARTECEVTKVNLSADGKMATGVTYIDANGDEWEQPAGLVLVCAFSLFNVRLLLLSGIGKPYDAARDEGVVGRNYAYQTGGGSTGFFEGVKFNPFAAAGSLGMALDDYNSDNFDHGPHGFVGGANITCAYSNGRPIEYHPTPNGTPTWGSAWKKAVRDNYQKVASVGAQGSVMSYRNNYLDLDPTYKDPLGRRLLRMTFDYKDNERKMATWMADRCDAIIKAMGTNKTQVHSLNGPWSVVPYQTTHNTGGAIFGDSPRTSVLNRYLQSWDVHNVFVMGASAFPQNAGYNPTGTVGALTYWALDAIFDYLKSPRALVPS